ncbi:Small-conductance mechanosensitive channel [Quadrisphaera granulorum]|uniref:Small-conductance mechanosensitive channel n=1 Tax=Quadrisphaera granulorum TaxID=317664 RepID=A0A316AMF5_9ACTN|nr:mechanosensitive ion channel family protein [Quadrisphaera granulorum]PWJ51187.1 small-conductance mechanosensitive channel [Quadrisphaera granulorum]SZE97837.1 Small-conductance mechanosensitive channel [Quadrisphaera granulorum]
MPNVFDFLAPLFIGDGAAGTTPLTGFQALQLVAIAAGAAIGALVLGMVIHAVVLRIGNTSMVARTLAARLKGPFRWILVTLAAQQVFVRSTGNDGWLSAVRTVLLLAVIACVGWLLAKVVLVIEDLLLEKFRVDVADNRHARRIRTQIIFLRRIALLVIALLTVGAMLWTFPEARVVGTGIFASAGLLSVVAGLAAQSSLSNVFAGLQLAFTDALRVDDVVVVEGEWGRIEEITLTYVVVHIWDDRRLVLPSTYFTSTPFQHWTRKDSQLLGVVLFEVDWRTDFDAMREEMHRVVEADELWDRRVAVLQVTDAVGSFVQVRILVSAQDGPTAFDLRCHVREAMVRWLVAYNPEGLPRVRLTGVGAEEAAQAALVSGAEERVPAKGAHDPKAPRRVPGPATPATVVLPPVQVPDRRDDSLFTGSMEAIERSKAFAGPSEAEQADRVERLLREERERIEAEERDAIRRRFREEPDPSLTTSVLPAVPEKRR